MATAVMVGGLMGMPLVFAQASTGGDVAGVQISRSGEVKLVGKLMAISGTNLTVASWGGSWTVDASKAEVVRRFGGDSGLSEYQVNDVLMVHGQASMAGLSIVAKVIKNESIQKRGAQFFGVITDLNASSTTAFSLKTEKFGNLAVTASSSLKIVINGQASSSTAGLANGMYAQVSGVWDRVNSTVIANTIIARTTENAFEHAKPSLLKKLFNFKIGKDKQDNDND